MTVNDIEALRQPSNRGQVVQKLRDSHHVIARLVASGLPQKEVALRAGYSQTRVSLLCAAPAMVELIARYRADEDASYRETRDEFYTSVHSAGLKSWRMINDQLDEADATNEPIPIQRLLAIADSAADRTGPSKKSTNMNINVDFASKLEAAIARSRAKTIELED